MTSNDVILVVLAAVGIFTTAGFGIASWTLLKCIDLSERVGKLETKDEETARRFDQLDAKIDKLMAKIDRLLSGESA